MTSRVLVGTKGGLFFTGSGTASEFEGREVRSLARQGSDWWAVIDQSEIWYREKSAPWTMVHNLGNARTTSILPTAGGVIVGMAGAHLLRIGPDGIDPLRGFDTIAGRDTWYTPSGSAPDVRSMAADSKGTQYVNVHVGGILRSDDDGQSWTPTIDVDSDVHEVVFDRTSGLLLAASGWGLGVSDDRGDTWRFDTDGLHGNYLRAVTVADDMVLVTASTGPFTNHAAVYRKPLDAAGSFERCATGLPDRFAENINTMNLAASGVHVSFATADGYVYCSQDAGATWTLETDGLPTPRCLAFDIDAAASQLGHA